MFAVGACLPLLVGLRWRALVRFEEHAVVPEREFVVLRRLSMFAPLPARPSRTSPGAVTPLAVDGGAVVVRRGDVGDDFYVVAEGVLDVSECALAGARRWRAATSSARSRCCATCPGRPR